MTPERATGVKASICLEMTVIEQGGSGFRNLGKKQVHMKNLMEKNTLDLRHGHKGNIYIWVSCSESV